MTNIDSDPKYNSKIIIIIIKFIQLISVKNGGKK